MNSEEKLGLEKIVMCPEVKTKLESPTKGDFRVWWIPQVGMRANPFYAPVVSLCEAKVLMLNLARYDAFQYLNNVKGDYANGGGLEQYIGEQEWDENSDGWYDWECPMFKDHPDLERFYSCSINHIPLEVLSKFAQDKTLDWTLDLEA